MQIIDALDYGMAKIADLMMKHILVPAISNIHVAVSVEVLQVGPEHSVSVLTIAASEGLKDNKDGLSLYSRIIDVIKFACKFICMENSKWVQSFAKLTWPRISDMVITHFLSKVWFFLISFASHEQPFSSMLGSYQLQCCHCEF